MKMVFCVMKESESWDGGENLVTIFVTKELAKQYIQKQRDPNLYRISSRKVLDKIC